MFHQVLITALGLGLASLLGSVAGLIVRRIPHRWNDIFLGFCAGMMLAASIVCLIMQAVEMVDGAGWWQVVAGAVAGMAFIGLLDRITPHLHHLSGLDPERHTHNSGLNRTLLFVIAIALHKFPEGLATGVTFNGAIDNAYAVALTIGLQNIPEGMVVVTPLLLAGISFGRTAVVGLCVAVLEVIGVVAGYFVGDISAIMLPFLLSMAGGAMLYIISDEMIPETHSHGYQAPATWAIVAGVLAMLAIDSAF